MKDLIMTLVPLILIMVLGLVARKTQIVKEAEVQGFKAIIVRLILPGVLFASFSHTELSTTTWLIALVMFLLCLLLYFYGILSEKYFGTLRVHEKGGSFMTGFEFGMMGVGLLSAIWGSDVLPLVMPVALGHELFIWFFYAPSLGREKGVKVNWSGILKQFVTTPTIIGISLGILINALGITSVVEGSLVGGIVYRTIDFIMPAVGPMILLYIGYNMEFSGLPVKSAISFTILRWIGVAAAIAIGYVSFGLLSGDLPALFYTGFFGFMLLPPPFIIPLFVKGHEAKAFYTKLLLMNTLISFVGYGVVLLLL